MTYDVVLLGATCTALGLAAGLPASCRVLLLNSSAMVAPEFVNAFRPGADWPREAVSPPAGEVLAAMQRENIFRHGDCRMYSAGAIFCQAFNQLSADLLFETDVEAVAPGDGGYELSICNAAGHSQIRTRTVIDTGTAGLPISGKSLNAVLAGGNPAAVTPADAEGVTFQRENDPAPPTVLMRVSCPVAESLFAARHRLIDRWRQLAAANPEWRIAAIALAFDETLPSGTKTGEVGCLTDDNARQTNKPDYVRFPSAGFANPLAAIDAGYAFAKRWT